MIQTASIVGLAKTILIIVLFYTIFKYVMRLLAPFFLRAIARKMERQFHHVLDGNSIDLSKSKL